LRTAAASGNPTTHGEYVTVGRGFARPRKKAPPLARSRIEIVGDALENQSDAVLAERAGAGDREAFEELYRRHSRTAMRVAYRVTGNIHDASDAVSDAFARVMQALPEGRLADTARFRSYLLTSTRHAAVDVLRRAGRAIPSETESEPAETNAGPSELLMDKADNALVAAAFRALPERWRSVLWLTEVEGVPAREAAGMLGVSANGVAQLAVRARAGLRERYLQAHLIAVDGECHETVSRLGAYVGGALGARELSRVDQHLASCDDCRTRETDLREIGTTLRRSALPLPLIGAASWARRLLDTVTSFAHSGGEAMAGAAAAAVFVASVAGVGAVANRQDSPTAPEAVASAPSVVRELAATVGVSPAPAPAPAPSGAPKAYKPTIVTIKPAPRTAAPTASNEMAAPAPSSTTTTTAPRRYDDTAPPPASHRDDEPIVDVPQVIEGIDLPGVPTTLPPVEEVVDDVVDVVDGVVDDVVDALPIDVLALESLLGAVDQGTLALLLAGADAPLPSPEAPGLPV
jgi:RNA polymerase sigma factor (sigma-70 family)